MIPSIYDQMAFGQAALKKFGTVPSNFMLYEAFMHPQPPASVQGMKVRGAEFVADPSGEEELAMVPGSSRTVFVSKAELQAIKNTTAPEEGQA